MARGSNIINDSVVSEAEVLLKKIGKIGTVSKKLHAVIAARTHGMQKVCDVMGMSRSSIYLWAKKIQEGDVEGLINKSKHQDGIKLKKTHQQAISDWLKEDPQMTIQSVREKLKKTFDMVLSTSTVHRSMRKAGFSYITSRKRHYKQEKDSVESFKKSGEESDSSR